VQCKFPFTVLPIKGRKPLVHGEPIPCVIHSW
jgi:hypothetical protein